MRGGDRASTERYAKDLNADPVVRFVSSTFLIWAIAGGAVAFGLGVALTGSPLGGLTALLWGGGVRIFLLHHVTFSINSLCHFFGRKRFVTGDESRNLAWLAPLSLGEAWHNNHYAFSTWPPTAGRAGSSTWRRCSSPLERIGLVWTSRITLSQRGEARVARGSSPSHAVDGRFLAATP
jgi:stearoyl-CoA desaturase (delta-9 desaturase)